MPAPIEGDIVDVSLQRNARPPRNAGGKTQSKLEQRSKSTGNVVRSDDKPKQHSLNESPDPAPSPAEEDDTYIGFSEPDLPDSPDRKDDLLSIIKKYVPYADQYMKNPANALSDLIDLKPLLGYLDKNSGYNNAGNYQRPLDKYGDLSEKIRQWYDSTSQADYKDTMSAIEKKKLENQIDLQNWAASMGLLPNMKKSMEQITADADKTRAEIGLKGAQTGKFGAETDRVRADIGRIEAIEGKLRADTSLTPQKRAELEARAASLRANAGKAGADTKKIDAEMRAIEQDIGISKSTGNPVGKSAPRAAGGSGGAASAKIKPWPEKVITSELALGLGQNPDPELAVRFNNAVRSIVNNLAADPNIKSQDQYNASVKASIEAWKKKNLGAK
jgi:hypothetical protein